MSATVVDASALAAVIFDEPEAAPIVAGARGPLLAPGLLLYELASICEAKLRKNPAQARLTLQRYRLVSSLDIEFAEPDWEVLPILAREWDLTAYDAAYLQLALKRRAPLVTLDARLARAHDRAAGRG